MKKMFFLLLPMLAAAWLAGLGGCRKCKIEGRVLEFGTEKPIPNATVSLTECEGEVLGSFNCFETARTVVGTDGAFAFKEAGISLSAEATGYWPTGDDFKLVFDECPELTTLYLYPHAWLMVTLFNQSGAYRINVPGSTDVSSGQAFYLSEGEITDFIMFQRGNRERNFLFSVYPTMNGPIQSLDSVLITDVNGNRIMPDYQNSASPRFGIFLPGHQTTKITITY